MPTPSERSLARWTAPECPLAVEYSPRVLDDIRLAVTDAFFSLPRGGAEIGGILVGRQERSVISIVDFAALDCEHAFGPSFVLSERDQDKLRELIAQAELAPYMKVLGWYHSHTRSEVFLSEADLAIHERFFPQPWQVALVVKPHTFQPMRAGFFFRESDGSIHAEAARAEFVVHPLPARPIPEAASAAASAPPAASPTPHRTIDVQLAPEIEPAPVPEPPPVPLPPPPAFLTPAPARSRSWIAWLAVVTGVALAVAAFASRGAWLPRVEAAIAARSAVEKLDFVSVERDGQLQFRWNGASKAARAATAGSLLIADGGPPIALELRPTHIQTGSFSWARQSGRVDATLILTQPGGKEVREATLFAGAAPPPPPESAEHDPSKEALVTENQRLREDLARQVERNKQLEKTLDAMRKAAQTEQKKRLGLQSRDVAR